jgi:hypothetical protein
MGAGALRPLTESSRVLMRKQNAETRAGTHIGIEIYSKPDSEKVAWKGVQLGNGDKQGDDRIFERGPGSGVGDAPVDGRAHRRGEPERQSHIVSREWGMKLSINHFILDHGFIEIGYLGIIENQTGFEERFRGYGDAMRERGLQIEEIFVRPWCPWDRVCKGRPVDELLEEWLKEVVGKRIEAIVGACDPIALWIMEHVDRIGEKSPTISPSAAMTVFRTAGFPLRRSRRSIPTGSKRARRRRI